MKVTITYDDTLYQLVPKKATPEMLSNAMKECGGIGGGSCGEHTGVDWDDMRSVFDAMLSAAPTPPAQPAERMPLTKDQIDKALIDAKVPELPSNYIWIEIEIARAIEAAHGITAPKEPTRSESLIHAVNHVVEPREGE